VGLRLNALVVPYDSGLHGARMGAGPTRLVESGIFDGLRSRSMEVTIAQYVAQEGEPRGEIASALDIQRWLAVRVAACRGEGFFPLVLAGNCMSAVGTFAGLRSRSRKVPGVCWFDAHGDFNTPETTESGFLDGMALATLTGRCWTQLTKSIPDFRPAPEASVLMFGTRSLDPIERKALSASGIHWPRTRRDADLDPEKLGALRNQFGEVYLHIDLDVLDEREGRANQFACAGGLTRAELLDTVRTIGASFHIGAAALTAYDPSCDPEGRIPPIAREIVEVIAESLT
jgi:arginase